MRRSDLRRIYPIGQWDQCKNDDECFLGWSFLISLTRLNLFFLITSFCRPRNGKKREASGKKLGKNKPKKDNGGYLFWGKPLRDYKRVDFKNYLRAVLLKKGNSKWENGGENHGWVINFNFTWLLRFWLYRSFFCPMVTSRIS